MVAQWMKNPTRVYEDSSSILGLTQWVKDLTDTAMSCVV